MNKLQIGLLAAVVLLGGGVAYFFMQTPRRASGDRRGCFHR